MWQGYVSGQFAFLPQFLWQMPPVHPCSCPLLSLSVFALLLTPWFSPEKMETESHSLPLAVLPVEKQILFFGGGI